MKKFNIFRLYVIEKDGYKFICEKNNENKYKECLTGNKMDVAGLSCIEPLKDYYSILALRKIEKERFYDSLMLTKKDILYKYLEINSQLDLGTNDKTSNEFMGGVPLSVTEPMAEFDKRASEYGKGKVCFNSNEGELVKRQIENKLGISYEEYKKLDYEEQQRLIEEKTGKRIKHDYRLYIDGIPMDENHIIKMEELDKKSGLLTDGISKKIFRRIFKR